MADNPTKGGGLGGFSQPQNPGSVAETDTKAIQDETRALQTETRSLQDHTRAVQADNKAREHWGRLAGEQETQLQRLVKGFHDLTGQLFSTKRMWEETTGIMSSYGRKLASATSATSAYGAKLKYIREGQKAYSGTLIATTNNISEAMHKSQQYVDAVHASYTNAKAIAGEFNVETAALDKAAGELTARFATQIAVSDDMSGAMKGMQREAFLLGAYLGVEMSEVMEMWQEQLDTSIKTLDEARKEIMAVTKVADKYAQEIQSLGKDYLKTGNIGKKEFLSMVRSIGKEMRTGTFNASAYAKAIKGVLVASKEDLHTTNEQRVAQEGIVKITKEMFTMGTKYSVFGMETAKRVESKWDDPKWMESIDQDLRKRLEITKKKFVGGSFEMHEAIMAKLKASGTGTAMGFEQMARGMPAIGVQRQVMKGEFAGDVTIADTVARQIKSGEIAQNFREKAAKDAETAKEQSTDMWKGLMGELVKAGHTSESNEDKMVRRLDSIDKYIQQIYTQFPFMIAGAQMGGALLGKVGPALLSKFLPGIAAKLGIGTVAKAAVPGMASFIGPVAPTLAGGGALSGAASATAAVAGPVLAVLSAAAAGVAVGTLIDHGVGRLLSNKTTLRQLGEDKTLSGWLGGSSTGRSIMGAVIGEPGMGDTNKKLEKMQEETTRMEGAEYQRRKELVEQYDKQIKAMEANQTNLDLVERQKLAAMKKEVAVVKKSIKRQLDRETKEVKGYRLAERVSAREKMRGQLRAKPGDAGAFIKGAGFTLPEMHMADFGQQLMDEIQLMPEDIRKQIGDPAAFVKKAQAERMKQVLTRGGYGVTGEELAGKSREEITALYKKETGKGLGPVTAMSQERVAQAQEARQRTSRMLGGLGIQDAFGGGGGSPTASTPKVNAKGEISMTSTLLLDGFSFAELIKKLNHKNTPK